MKNSLTSAQAGTMLEAMKEDKILRPDPDQTFFKGEKHVYQF
ncbi:MAG: hypothetical protein QME28_00340 [Candidatus Saccharicenans sp.]|nr:hypothetical protein [Candidatus Saccharicenans sp.]